ncbi:aldo/keto reductase [Aureimonas sp. ME7]|uniref:aldo/keto reductase n=1 Tax=Aureimonas sp. ME7 TaxID=2744252 RepID=UPI0015F65FAD|nr:aldo/keto reductase [Aureimonas sp. ME7]
MKTIDLPGGITVPALGQGTWMMAEGNAPREREIEALRAGIDLGMTLIDTAEIYGDGASEVLVGEAIRDRRDEVFLVSKVAPSNASREGTRRACEASLQRLGTDRLDLYLLHWRGRHPLSDTVAAMEDLVSAGRIGRWGVSNFDLSDMEELVAVPGGANCAVNQILYNLEERGPEFDLLPWQAEHGIPVMAYSPVGQGGALLEDDTLAAVAERHVASPARIALAFLLQRPGVIAIPKAATRGHVEDNAAAAGLELDADDLAALEEAFPAPTCKVPLAMI